MAKHRKSPVRRRHKLAVRPAQHHPRWLPPRLRTVTFGSWSARVVWAALGVALGVGGYLAAAPAFAGSGAPPPSWAVWMSAGPRSAGGAVINVVEEAPHSCGRSNVLTTLTWGGAKPRYKQKIRYVLAAISGHVQPSDIRARFDVQGRWTAPYHTTFRAYGQQGEIVFVRIPPAAQTLELSMKARIATHAGHLACYVATPELEQYAANETALDNMQELGDHWMDETKHQLPGLGCCIAADGVADSAVAGMTPDRGALDAGGLVVGNRVRVICGIQTPDPTGSERDDPYYYWTALAATSNCGAVQTFRAPNAGSDLNVRLFIAGALISAAAAILIEALAVGHGRLPDRAEAPPAALGGRPGRRASRRSQGGRAPRQA